ncbi:helix-turn-helix transcriptional regulator [Clostridium sp. KNHs214]|uniref:helix-turn-helix domain-containing protein n=1 Tax=Clostridium sp. KNHs214 TaxID=1540257 RepID=UPI00068D945A|nr:helix-turn-helix transcriptional regulator [Clostridium sp. KNHs214]
MINNIEIGKRIKERREELGLTIQYIADKVKVHKSTIQRYETGNIKDIKIPVIESIAKALQVNPMWIIGEVNIKEMHSAEYEQVTYLSNIYFQGVMKWSEDNF